MANFVDELLGWAGAIAKCGVGENASISKAFSRTAREGVQSGAAAMRADFNSISRGLIDSAIANKVITPEQFDKLRKAKNFSHEKLADGIARMGAKDDASQAYKDALAKFNKQKDLLNKGDAKAYFGRDIGWKEGLKGYFSDPQDNLGHTRTVTTLGGAFAGAVGMRYLSGGSLTTDPQGRRNIAGVPFI